MIEEAEAVIVRRIFDLCLSGMSTYAIALQLSRERVQTRGNGRRVLKPGIWQASSVHRLLTNKAYVGRTYFTPYERTENPRKRKKTRRRLRPGEECTVITVPAIVDAATFTAVQLQLDRNRELSPRKKKRDYLLSGGRLRCGRCGKSMTGGCYRGTTRYRCSSMGQTLDPEARCYRQLKAADVEPQVWGAVVRLLEQPDLIRAEVARQEASADHRRSEIERELTLIDAALGKCDREGQRWADAYASEVINLVELKSYRAEIDARRQSLLAQQATCQQRLEAIGQAVGQVEALSGYCARVRQRLRTFDAAEKRLAFEALDLRVTWTPGQPLQIEGSIPLEPAAQGEAVPIAS